MKSSHSDRLLYSAISPWTDAGLFFCFFGGDVVGYAVDYLRYPYSLEPDSKIHSFIVITNLHTNDGHIYGYR